MAKRKASASDAASGSIDALIEQASSRKMKVLFLPSPQALGATYAEVMANLDKIAAAELPLHIVPPRHRRGIKP